MTAPISGFCEDRFAPLKDAFSAHFDQGLELGASLAVTHREKLVVDLWGGWADPARTRPWERDTIVPVASTTKIMIIIAALMLVDRGLIELDAPIARYWPEFAQGGKVGVTVRDAFTHQAGVPGFEPPAPYEAMYDWAGITARLAAQPHWFDGRRRVIYHGLTYGFPLGELIRRVDGRAPSRFFREEIADKTGADFQMGLTSKSDLPRVADILFPTAPPSPPAAGSLLARLLASWSRPVAPTSWEYRSAVVPAAVGFGNGRSIARVCAILAMGGELDGERYMSGAMVEEAATEQAYGECPYLGWVKLGLGFGLDSKEYPYPSPTTFGWGGFGGSWGVMDPRTGVSVGYAPNNWSLEPDGVVDPRLQNLSIALEKLLPGL
jgi:CubicO group peptidase (beta-lactamase class C family)